MKVGQRWQAVCLGELLKDPATGRSLGRNEQPCGTVRIDRIATQTSYGTLEGAPALVAGKPFKPGQIELRKVATASASSEPGATPEAVPARVPSKVERDLPARTSTSTSLQEEAKPEATPKAAADTKW